MQKTVWMKIQTTLEINFLVVRRKTRSRPRFRRLCLLPNHHPKTRSLERFVRSWFLPICPFHPKRVFLTTAMKMAMLTQNTWRCRPLERLWTLTRLMRRPPRREHQAQVFLTSPLVIRMRIIVLNHVTQVSLCLTCHYLRGPTTDLVCVTHCVMSEIVLCRTLIYHIVWILQLCDV